MGLLVNTVGGPLVGPVKLVRWLSVKISDVVEEETAINKDKLKAELSEWQMKLDIGEVTQEEYENKEKEILEKLKQ